MKVLVMGSSGMAGHVVGLYLREKGYDVTKLAGTRRVTDDTILLDVTNLTLLNEYLSENKFDVIINCVAVLTAQAEKEKSKAVYLNAFLPRHLESWFADTHTKVVQLSTDCVFSGENGPYKENDYLDGQLFYDRSKALGELDNGKDLTFRTSIIGPELKDGSGLFHWFMQQDELVNGFTNVIWSGITTLELARGIDAAIAQNLRGIYHLVSPEPISKYDLLNIVGESFGRDVEVKPDASKVSNRTLLNTRKDFDFQVSSYDKMILELREWMKKYGGIYNQYWEKLYWELS